MNPLLELMIPTTLAQHNEQIAVTALPNGRTTDQGLKLSLLFILSLPTGQGISNTWFENWNSDDVSKASIGAALRMGEWTFAFSDSTTQTGTTLATLKQKPQPYTRVPEMWARLFKDSAASAISERKTARLKAPWHVTHDAAYLNYVFKRHHRARSAQRFAQRRGANTFSDAAKSTLDGQFASIDIYLHPNLGDTTTNIPIKDQLKGRADLLDPGSAMWMPTVTGGLISTDNRDFLTERFQYGLSVLDSVDQPLAPLGLLGLWRHCALSLPFDPQRAIGPVLSAIDTITMNLKFPLNSLSQAQRMVEFLLSSRKKDTSTTGCSTLPDADFHQMLGMVNRYPALLRPLGLAVDMTLPLPAQPQKAALLTITPPINDSSIICFRTAIYIGPAGAAGEPEFCARSRYDDFPQGTPPQQIDDGYRLLRNRYLWLGATSQDDGNSALFYATSQDATGSAHKTVNASFSYRRGSQYRQYPTKVRAQQTAPDALPASRTAGIQLFHVARAARSQKLSENDVDPKHPRVLFADDLILGYRVDMTDGRKDKEGKQLTWFSLCERRSSYECLDHKFKWEPRTPEDLAADEGFVTLGGVVEDGDNSTVVRMDQGLWTWNGENFSIRPFFSDAAFKPPAKVIFPLAPTYGVADHSELPQRFEKTYSIRNRMVDLCGNSPKLGQCVPRDSASNDAVTLSHEFLREEPFRGPQVLLREPIDRVSHPGDNIATLVLRDGSGMVERAVVPPREIRQLAEWAGKLDQGLPRGAFEQFWLDDKGRFITVQDEENNGPDDNRQVNSEKQDGLLRLGKTVPRHRYFPDPYVSCACIQFNPPGDSTRWTSTKARYLSFYAQNSQWPHANPVLLRLEPTDRDPHFKVDNVTLFPPTTFANTPGITFYIPKATDAIIELSSAACAEESPSNNVVRIALASTPERMPASSQDNHRRPSGANFAVPSGQSSTLVSTNSSTSNTPPEIHESEILKAMGLGERAVLGRQTDDQLVKSGFWTNGQNPTVSPPHQVRLVHAVKTPLRQPVVTDLALRRNFGETNAQVSGTVDPCIRSTGKITFHASYDLYIDDPSRPKPYCAHYQETAFEVELPNTPLGLSPSDYLKGKQHIFHDNRARSITYSTVATSKFLGFYPQDPKKGSNEFAITQKLPTPVQLKATVRPPAPVIAYIIPSFRWDETNNKGTFHRKRVCHLRVYMERPHPITDNDQMLGVVLAPAGKPLSPSVNPLVSRIGMDPTQANGTSSGLTRDTMDASMFSNPTQVGAGLLAESAPAFAADSSDTGAVDILGYCPQFVESRNQWFVDIQLDPTEKLGNYFFRARSPFVQLALTRYAPNGLVGDSPAKDARMSAVVMADIIQLAEDRSCTLSRNGKSITLCISGPFVESTKAADQKSEPSRMRWEWSRETRISVELQHRWHSVEEEVSWLPVWPVTADKAPFTFKPDDMPGTATLTFKFDLPHSPSVFKYAVLVMEEEILPAKDPAVGKVYRTRYFDQIEI